MSRVEQGDLLKIESFKNPSIVVSNNFFNQSGMVLVCPVMKNALEGPLHIQLKESPVEGYVLCEQVRYVDLTQRCYSKLSTTHYYDIMDISDAVMSMFDYLKP